MESHSRFCFETQSRQSNNFLKTFFPNLASATNVRSLFIFDQSNVKYRKAQILCLGFEPRSCLTQSTLINTLRLQGTAVGTAGHCRQFSRHYDDEYSYLRSKDATAGLKLGSSGQRISVLTTRPLPRPSSSTKRVNVVTVSRYGTVGRVVAPKTRDLLFQSTSVTRWQHYFSLYGRIHH